MVFGLDARLLGARQWRVYVLAGLLGLAGTACDRPTDVVPVSWLAVVTLFDDSLDARDRALRYRVTELSGTLGIDTIVSRAAADTLVLDLPEATYEVELLDLPATCSVARGTVQYVVVYPAPSTALARYFVLCRPALLLAAVTDGLDADSLYTWTLSGPSGSRVGLIGANDTLRLENLAPGRYDITLSHLAGNCVAVSDGGRRQSIVVDSTGGAALTFRVTCSRESQRPRLLRAAASAHDSAAALTFAATDPDRDIERYVVDVTDCDGRSVLPGGSRLRRGLSSGRTAQADTVRVVVGFDLPLSAAELAGRCAALRVADEYGNTTPVHELPLATAGGSRPVATSFNARIAGGMLITDVQPFDSDGDFAGYFVQLRVRDGVFGITDGKPDIALYNTAGYEALPLPQVQLGTGVLEAGDVFAVTVFLVDRRGLFTRLEDADIFR